MDELQIRKEFGKGYNCAQVILSYYVKDLGLDEKIALKIASGLGAGMFEGDSCGAVLGAVMVIGLKYGSDPKDVLIDKTIEFRKKFNEKFGSCMCKELLGYDISIPEEMDKLQKSNKTVDLCPILVKGSIDILKDIL
jgi:C_GCAxxG_C_C family probable redox protein